MSYQKVAQGKLTSINQKFAYHISNLFLKTTKFFIHFVLSLAWICIQKTILKDHKSIATQVINTKDLKNILKSDMGYKELSKIRKSLEYLD